MKKIRKETLTIPSFGERSKMWPTSIAMSVLRCYFPIRTKDQIILVQAQMGQAGSHLARGDRGRWRSLAQLWRNGNWSKWVYHCLGQYYGQADEYFLFQSIATPTLYNPAYMLWSSGLYWSSKTTGRFLQSLLGHGRGGKRLKEILSKH